MLRSLFSKTSSPSQDTSSPAHEKPGFDGSNPSSITGDKYADEAAIAASSGFGDADAENMPPRTSGFAKSVMNVVCVVIGSGCLQISYAFSKTGWVGVLFIILSAAISMYTGHLSIKSLYHKPGHRLYSASDTARAAYGRIGQFVMEFFSYLYTLGTACLYMILAGQFLKQLVEDHTSIDKRVWIVILAVVMWVPVALFKFLTEATILALFGFLTSCVVILVGTIQSLRFPEYPHFHDSAIGGGVPVALSSILFSFAGSVIYPHVEASMKKPQRWPLVIMCAMTICGMAYLLIGCAGYWAYGRNVQSPLLDSIPHDNANKATVGLVMIHVIMAGPILMFSFFVEIEKKYRIQASHMGKKKELIVRVAYRTITVAVVCAVAVALPFFSSILSLIGALSCGMILAVLPVVVYLKLYGWRSVPWYELIWMFVVVAIGLIACVWGSIDAIQSLIKDVNNQ